MTFLLLLVSTLVPLPYILEYPGPTVNVLADYDGKTLINVPDAAAVDGELLMTTVSISGGPGQWLTAATLLQALASSEAAVAPREALFPDALSASQSEQISQAQMNSSQENAIIAALESMGYDLDVELEVATITAQSDAKDKLAVDDILVSIAAPGEPTLTYPSYRELTGLLARVPVGTTVKVEARRNDETLRYDIATIAPPVDAEGRPQREGSLLGIGLYTHLKNNPGVEFSLGDQIGGPSAGLMFALGIIDKLTDESLTGANSIAGTGTIAIDGQVGPIGGVNQKMLGAYRDGARYFLVPADNWDEAQGHVPAGMTAIRVETLDEALQTLREITAGKPLNLPHEG
ncbi:MAG: S16 family serine protease [Bowdeniella nasicola]|nr:S16 family serine protease [Bowdeniella nasicola]